MAALPAHSSNPPPWEPSEGRHRLRKDLQSGLRDEDLRALALDLGAQRTGRQYLDALCIVIANQARAERFGYVLELNVRAPFTSERTMRTILGQMKAAGITYGRVVQLGQGRSQVVQCFGRARPACADEDGPEELERSYREVEAEAEARRAREVPRLWPPIVMRGVPEHLVSFSRSLTTQ